MTRKYTRRGQKSASISSNDGVETVSTDALNKTTEMPQLYAGVPPAQMVTVNLSRHYRPSGPHEVVGHWRPKVEVKNAAGNMVELSPAEFVAGEPMPPPLAGVGGESVKLWAGTVVRLPKEEARNVRRAEIGTIEIED